MTDLQTIEDQRTELSNDDGDHERFSHIIIVPKGQNAQAVLTEARIYGFPCQALCGKQWVPTRDPEKFPMCPDCARMYEEIKGKKWGT
jgi:hypothetical protein